MLDSAKLGRFVDQVWGDTIVPTLVDYIRIPNKSPAFDPDWAAHGHMEEAVAMFERWARERLAALPGTDGKFGCLKTVHNWYKRCTLRLHDRN